MSSPDYLSYKKKKQQLDSPNSVPVKDLVIRICLVTFVAIFCIVAFTIKNYSSKLDIEMAKDTGYGDNFDDTIRSKIDERLKQIQLEESLPSVSKSTKKKNEMDEVIDTKKFDEFAQKEKITPEDIKAAAKNTLKEDLTPVESLSPSIKEVNFQPNPRPQPSSQGISTPPRPVMNSGLKPPFEAKPVTPINAQTD